MRRLDFKPEIRELEEEVSGFFVKHHEAAEILTGQPYAYRSPSSLDTPKRVGHLGPHPPVYIIIELGGRTARCL